MLVVSYMPNKCKYKQIQKLNPDIDDFMLNNLAYSTIYNDISWVTRFTLMCVCVRA